MKAVRMQGILVGLRRMFEDMNNAIECNRLKPVIDRTFEFEEAITSDWLCTRGPSGSVEKPPREVGLSGTLNQLSMSSAFLHHALLLQPIHTIL
jgi:hypothetical protein